MKARHFAEDFRRKNPNFRLSFWKLFSWVPNFAILAILIDKYVKRELNFAIQAFSRSPNVLKNFD